MVTVKRVVAWSVVFISIVTNSLYALSIKAYTTTEKPSIQDDKNFISDMISSYPEIISLVDSMGLGRMESSDKKLSLILPRDWKRIESKTPNVISLIDKSAELTVSKIEISSENMDRYSPENILTIFAMSLIGKSGHTYDKLRVIKSGKRVMTSIHIVEENNSNIAEHYYTMQIIKNHIYLIGVSVNPAYEQLGKFLSELAIYSLWTEEMIPTSVSQEVYDEEYNKLVTSISDPQISLNIDSDDEKAIDITDSIPSSTKRIYASTTTYRAFSDDTLSIRWYRYIDNRLVLIKKESRDVVGSEFVYSYLEYSRGDFPIGRYRVVFDLDGMISKVKNFEIVE
ncbi:hypothetical protein MNB_SV-6-1465 [hydrothermal vent metagenome]|uniref:Uncharacterized protein n=1 Tax=hydrothermal vent metagenome TaxID=652676 RepID=A0A1W1BCP6_9ZZZZ